MRPWVLSTSQALSEADLGVQSPVSTLLAPRSLPTCKPQGQVVARRHREGGQVPVLALWAGRCVRCAGGPGHCAAPCTAPAGKAGGSPRPREPHGTGGCRIPAPVWEGDSRPPVPCGWQSCRVSELFLTQRISAHSSAPLERGSARLHKTGTGPPRLHHCPPCSSPPPLSSAAHSSGAHGSAARTRAVTAGPCQPCVPPDTAWAQPPETPPGPGSMGGGPAGAAGTAAQAPSALPQDPALSERAPGSAARPPPAHLLEARPRTHHSPSQPG